MQSFLDLANEYKDEFIKIRRDIHQNPELGFDVYRTSGVVKKFLKENGIEYKEYAKTGVCAYIGKNTGKTIAVRADMDALPLQEKNTCSYASKVKGKMHACGHDAHTAILLLTAKILNMKKEELKGRVELFFEPAEETVGGARFMIKEGILDDPYVDAVIGLHVNEEIDTGTIGIKRGVLQAASNPFTVTIKGKGSHGAKPELSIDPIYTASSIIVNLQEIVSREICPCNPCVLTVGTIHGGTAQNIIPDEVTFSGIMRTLKNEDREYVKKRFTEIVEGISKTMRTECSINIEESYPCLYNDDHMYDMIVSSAEKVLKKENINILENPSMGVESFAYFTQNRPSAFFFLGCRKKGVKSAPNAHSSRFDVDESCIPIGAAIECETVYKYLNDLK